MSKPGHKPLSFRSEFSVLSTGCVFVPAFCGAPERLLEIEEDEIKVRKSLTSPGAMEKEDEGFLYVSPIS